jgi:hypothetical protein
MDVYTAREMHGSDENEGVGPTIDRISVRKDACWRVVRCEYFTRICLKMWWNAWNGVRMHMDDAAYTRLFQLGAQKKKKNCKFKLPGVAPRCAARERRALLEFCWLSYITMTLNCKRR